MKKTICTAEKYTETPRITTANTTLFLITAKILLLLVLVATVTALSL
jgi:hypothetical protein